MSEYFLAPALGSNAGAYSTTGLFGEINERFPNRSHLSDGWIGDASHAARKSDHNPDWGASGRYNGIVRAIDIDIAPDGRADRDLRRDVLEACIGDHRVWYVISNWIIYSRTYGWSARRYTGSNGHTQHVHVSLRHFSGEFDTSPWFETEKPKRRIKAKPVHLDNVREQFLIAAGDRKGEIRFHNGVGRMQQVFNRQYDESLKVDGLVGRETLQAWRRFERTLPERLRRGQLRVPDHKSLPVFGRGRFRVVL